MWQPLIALGLQIHFAWRSFAWSSDAAGLARVHCVIVGFGKGPRGRALEIFERSCLDGPWVTRHAQHICAYLVDHADVVVHTRATPLSPCLPGARYGNKPADGGHLIVSSSALTECDALAMKHLRIYVGAEELATGKRRHCIWMPEHHADAARSAFLRGRIEGVRAWRGAPERTESTRKLADRPYRFFRIPQPDQNYVAIPRHVSETRRWFTVDRFPATVIASDALFTVVDPDGWVFGVLSSEMFIAWLRTVGGSLESRLRFSGLVYNAFPLPVPCAQGRARVVGAASAVVDARAQFPGLSLAQLYEPGASPEILERAHDQLDRAVDAVFAARAFRDHDDRVDHLFDRYVEMTGGANPPSLSAMDVQAPHR